MTAINLTELEQRGLNIADAARLTGIPYARLWRASTGGLQKGFTRAEQDSLNRLMADNERRRTAIPA